MFMKRQEGFTLIELLIVIVIIGILAALAIPRFTQNIADAQANTCKGNLAMLENAYQRYLFDFGGAPANVDALVTPPAPPAGVTVSAYIAREPLCPTSKTGYTFTGATAVCGSGVTTHAL